MTEAQFQAKVIAAARQQGWLVYHTYDSRKSEPGFPDLVMVRRPRMICAELKVKPNKPSPEQLAWLEELAACNGDNAFVWYPEDWDEIVVELTRREPATRLEILAEERE